MNSNDGFNAARAQAAQQQAAAQVAQFVGQQREPSEEERAEWRLSHVRAVASTYAKAERLDVIEGTRVRALQDRKRFLDAKLETNARDVRDWTEERDRIDALLGQVNEAS